MAVSYYGVRLPDKKNWVETPEGYMIFRNAIIGRTGFQNYKGYELDKDELMEQGFPVNDEDDIQVYRSPDEVFSAATIASFECKSITEGHPSELLSIENVKQHEQGQIINVRQGKDALESGDYPLLADLVVKSKSLLDKIKLGLRELSCGYNYHVLKDGDLIKQIDIIGNHVAIVENARAGREAVIVDSISVTSTLRFNIMNFLDTVLNRNSKSKVVGWAKDAKPEEVADVITELSTELDKRSIVTTAKSAAQPTAQEIANDRLHIALDKALKGEGSDAEVKELKKALSKGIDKKNDEKEKEEEKGEDAEEEEEEEEKKGEDAEEEEEGKGEDESSLIIEPEDRPKTLGPGTLDSNTLAAARVEGATAVLRQLKPFIARSGNKKLLAAYDTAVKVVTGKSKASTTGGYAVFAIAANSRSKDAQDSVDKSTNKNIIETISSYEKQYAERFNVVKRG